MCFLCAFACVAEDEAMALERHTTDCMAEDTLMPRQVSEHYSPPIIPNYPPQNRRLLPLAMVGVVEASMLQILTPQQALEAAACGKAVARAECALAGVVLPAPAPPAMQHATSMTD